MDQEEVNSCASHPLWHCWHTGWDFDEFGTDAEAEANQTPFMETGDRM